MKYTPLILSGVCLNAFAQLFLKKGMMKIGIFNFSINNVVPITLAVVKNPSILLGLLCYVISVIIWLLVLSRVEVSYAYPFLSIGYIVTAIIGYLAFNENLSITRIAGIVVICIGVILISKS
ncbi:EamA family transporter [candidate division WOR-3 bacterium]|nr:EamA family transporter [candidate division WOR-3 bacterium]